jgi:5-methyltetrahydropteroyltriglutamate--homocysteine methyltransferase
MNCIVAEVLFKELNVDIYFLEFDDSRSGNFEPLRFLPKGKTVVLGLVSSKHAKLESKESIVARIKEASQYAPLDQLALSAQCGFGKVARL